MDMVLGLSDSMEAANDDYFLKVATQ